MKKKVLNIVSLVILLAIIITIIYLLEPLVKNISTTEGQIEFKQKLDNLGWKSVLVLFVIQLIQIFLIIIPGEPIEILAGMCYGTVWGTMFIILSSSIVGALIILLVKKLGKKFIYAFCDKNKVKKIENNKLFQNPKKIEIIMLILYFIPGTPKDLLVYVAGILPINPVRFIIISNIARIPSIVISTMGGAKITNGNWLFVAIANLVVFIVAIVIVLVYNKFDKEKIAEKALKVIEEEKS